MKKKFKHCLGVYDAVTAMAAEKAGIEMLFIDSLGASTALLGSADAGLVTLTEMAALARRIAGSVSIPVLVDGREGYGGVHNVQRAVQEFEAVGAAGVVFDDRSVPAADMVLKLSAAMAARKKRSFQILTRKKMGYDIVVYPIESLLAAAEAVRVLAGTILGRAETVEKRRPHGSRR